MSVCVVSCHALKFAFDLFEAYIEVKLLYLRSSPHIIFFIPLKLNYRCQSSKFSEVTLFLIPSLPYCYSMLFNLCPEDFTVIYPCI